MATAFSETSVPAQSILSGVKRQRLLGPERVKSDKLLLDRLQLTAGAELRLDVSTKSLVWLQVLNGKARLNCNMYTTDLFLNAAHSVLLLPGRPATLSSDEGACLLYAEVPDAGPLD